MIIYADCSEKTELITNLSAIKSSEILKILLLALNVYNFNDFCMTYFEATFV
jgi:hypothetical protein